MLKFWGKKNSNNSKLFEGRNGIFKNIPFLEEKNFKIKLIIQQTCQSGPRYYGN
jgi:hypothetical protein